MKKRSFAITLLLLTALLLAACSGGGSSGPADAQASPAPKEENATQITLSDEGVQVKGRGAKADRNVVTIASAGVYAVAGSIGDGQVIVDTGDEALDVTLILSGADITNLSGPAIFIRQAKNTRLQLAAGTENRVVSGTEADMARHNDDSSGAAIYAEDDLDIEGEGALTVLGYINNGIACKDDLDINSGVIRVTAANNGVRGSESVDVKGGELTVTAGNDGVKSTVADKADKGTVTISGGAVTVDAGGDGVSAETALTVSGGTLAVSTSGDPLQVSCKGVKAGTDLLISGGSLTVSSPDHAVHSGGSLTVSDGQVNAVSSDGKALAAHADITISGGELILSAKGDGVETPGNVTIAGGTVEIGAGDDGVQAGEANSGLGTLSVSGGTVKISASGRGVNARGELLLTGGEFIALSGSDKDVIPSPQSGRLYLKAAMTGSAGDPVSLLDKDGQELISLTAAWPYRTVTVCLSNLAGDASYTLSRVIDSATVEPVTP